MTAATTQQAAVTQADVATWAAGLTTILQAAWIDARNVGEPPVITVMDGPRWMRIVCTQGSASRSAYGFIDRSTGLIFKADGWKSPAKGARGDMNGADPYAGCGPYGMAYRR